MSKSFCCKIEKFTFIYLGVSIHHERIRRDDIQPMIDKTMKRNSG
jgi:hypothetical protein